MRIPAVAVAVMYVWTLARELVWTIRWLERMMTSDSARREWTSLCQPPDRSDCHARICYGYIAYPRLPVYTSEAVPCGYDGGPYRSVTIFAVAERYRGWRRQLD